MNKLLKLIRQYQSLTSMGLCFEGMQILQEIDKEVLRFTGDVKTSGNCITLRELVSDLLFL